MTKLQDTDFFLYSSSRDGSSKKVKASKLEQVNVGNILYNRGGKSYRLKSNRIKPEYVQDTDYFLVQRNGRSYKMSGLNMLDYYTPPIIWSDYFVENLWSWPGSVQGRGKAVGGPGGFNGNITALNSENAMRAYGDSGTGAGWFPPATIPCSSITAYLYNDRKSNRYFYSKVNDIDFTTYGTVEGQIHPVNVSAAAKGGLFNARFTNSLNTGYPGHFGEGNGWVGVKCDGHILQDGVPLPFSMRQEFLRRWFAKRRVVFQAEKEGFGSVTGNLLGEIAHDRICNDWCLMKELIDEEEYDRRQEALETQEVNLRTSGLNNISSSMEPRD